MYGDLESRVEDALTDSWCELKYDRWDLREIPVEYGDTFRSFATATIIISQTGEQVQGLLDLSTPHFGNRLIVSSSGCIIEEAPFEVGGLLFSRYRFQNADSDLEMRWIYFIDINFEIAFPQGYTLVSADDTYIRLEHSNGDVLRYNVEEIKEYGFEKIKTPNTLESLKITQPVPEKNPID